MGKKTPEPVHTSPAHGLDPAVLEKGKRWFAEARAQTESDIEEINTWIDRNTGGFDESGEWIPSPWRLKAPSK